MKRLAILALILGTATAGCRTLKPYEKEYLLSPVMDDKELATLGTDSMPKMFSKFERLSAGGAGSAGTSCLTCGG